MTDHDRKLEKFVNSSGFPLQIGLQHLVNNTRSSHGWHVLSYEHPWLNNNSGNNGFIDIVLEEQNKVQIMVIECKRVRDTSWIFLVPSKHIKPRRHANTWFTNIQNNQIKYFDWYDLTLVPDWGRTKVTTFNNC